MRFEAGQRVMALRAFRGVLIKDLAVIRCGEYRVRAATLMKEREFIALEGDALGRWFAADDFEPAKVEVGADGGAR